MAQDNSIASSADLLMWCSIIWLEIVHCSFEPNYFNYISFELYIAVS